MVRSSFVIIISYTSFYQTYIFLFVVGAGSAGSVLASRLSENPEVSILLLEAGINDREAPLTNIPIMSYFLPKTNIDWQYKTERQGGACLGMVDQVIMSHEKISGYKLTN